MSFVMISIYNVIIWTQYPVPATSGFPTASPGALEAAGFKQRHLILGINKPCVSACPEVAVLSALLFSKALGEYHELLLQLCQTPPGVPQELTAFKYSPPDCRNQNQLSPRSSHGVTFLAGLQMCCFISTSFSVTAHLQGRSRDHPVLLSVHSSLTVGEAGGSRHELAGGQGCILGTSEWCRTHQVPAPALLSGSSLGLALPGAGTRWALGFEVLAEGGSQPQTQPGAGGSPCVRHTQLQGSLMVAHPHCHCCLREGTEAQSWITALSVPAWTCCLWMCPSPASVGCCGSVAELCACSRSAQKALCRCC